MTTNYSWITQDMFDAKLEEILREENGAQLLPIPGIYEILSEAYNNEVLDALEDDKYD